MKIVWIFILLGLLMAMIYLFVPLADVFDELSANFTTTDYSGVNATTISPTSEALAGSWKYLVAIVLFGGILYLIYTVMSRKSE